MLKLKNNTGEYEVLGQITFLNDDEVEQTNYTIIVDGETVTVSSFDGYELIEVPDPEPTVEPEPTIENDPPMPPEDLERKEWLFKFALLEKSLKAKKKLEEVGLSFSDDEQTRFDALVSWVAANRKIEYVDYL